MWKPKLLKYPIRCPHCGKLEVHIVAYDEDTFARRDGHLIAIGCLVCSSVHLRWRPRRYPGEDWLICEWTTEDDPSIFGLEELTSWP